MKKRVSENAGIREYGSYVSGSAARQISTAPARRQEEQRKKELSSVARRNREKAREMSLGYVIFLALATCALGLVCIVYINIQSDVAETTKNIASLTSSVETLTAQNDSLDYSINSYMDTSNIIKVATEELGMVRASGNQIIYYNSTESEYMKQFKDVPNE